MIFWINGGNAAACQLARRLVTSVITPVSKVDLVDACIEMPFIAWVDSTSSPCINAVRRCLALEDGQTDVDGVAIEDTRERGRDNAGNAVLTENERCVLTGGAAAEVAGCDNDVARVHILHEIRVDVLHCVGGQLLWVCDIQITCGDDNVGIENLAFCVHGMCFLPYFRSSGAQI